MKRRRVWNLRRCKLQPLPVWPGNPYKRSQTLSSGVANAAVSTKFYRGTLVVIFWPEYGWSRIFRPFKRLALENDSLWAMLPLYCRLHLCQGCCLGKTCCSTSPVKNWPISVYQQPNNNYQAVVEALMTTAALDAPLHVRIGNDFVQVFHDTRMH